MKFKVGDKVRLIEIKEKYRCPWKFKIKDGIVTKVFTTFITVKRGRSEQLWNPVHWRKVK